jgi:hypothetical protein
MSPADFAMRRIQNRMKAKDLLYLSIRNLYSHSYYSSRKYGVNLKENARNTKSIVILLL